MLRSKSCASARKPPEWSSAGSSPGSPPPPLPIAVAAAASTLLLLKLWRPIELLRAERGPTPRWRSVAAGSVHAEKGVGSSSAGSGGGGGGGAERSSRSTRTCAARTVRHRRCIVHRAGEEGSEQGGEGRAVGSGRAVRWARARTQWFCESASQTSPEGPTAIPLGTLKRASALAPSTRPHARSLLPASVLSVRDWKSRRRRLLLVASVTATVPSASTASPHGLPNVASPSGPSLLPAADALPQSVPTLSSAEPGVTRTTRSACEPASATYTTLSPSFSPLAVPRAITALGWSKDAVAAGPSPLPGRPQPASVLTTRFSLPPPTVMARMQWLPLSHTRTLPSPHTHTAMGVSKVAEAAAPSVHPRRPLPAKTLTAPSAPSRRMRLWPLSHTRTPPSGSCARPRGRSHVKPRAPTQRTE